MNHNKSSKFVAFHVS